MREESQSRIANFRISNALLTTAAARARQNGTTLSEFIRSAIQREVRN